MIAEVRVPRGLCNIIPDLFIKFNSLLETACTHDLGTGRYGKAPGVLTHTHTHYAHTNTHYENSQTCAVHPVTQWQTHTHLITHLPPPPPPQRLDSPPLPFVSNAKLSLDEAAVFLWQSFVRFVVCFCLKSGVITKAWRSKWTLCPAARFKW